MLLGFLSFGQLPAFGLQSVTLAWDPSPDPTVVGYNVYYGAASGSYTNKLDAGNATSLTITNLVEGATYYFAVTAYNAAGLESDPSNEASYTVPLPPTVTLAAPANGASYPAPATINLSANVTTNGHTITQVQFYNGTTLLGSGNVPPYTFAWSSVSAGSYSLIARLFYDSGASVDSAAANITVSNPAPVVALTAPANGASYLAPATLNLSASVTTNGHTITQVQFYSGTTLLGAGTLPPYTFAWNNVSAGAYSLKARLFYDSGATLDSAAASVTVTNALPAIALTAPANGNTYLAPATINLAASVTTNSHTITQVQFFNGNTLLGSGSVPPYAFTWNSVGAGSYNLKARVIYDAGSALDSAVVSVTATNPLPVVALTAPANGANYLTPATITLSANVTTNGHTINQVQFYNGTTLLGNDTLPPYTFTWNSVGPGSYNLKARLVYDSVNTLDTALASVTVTNPLPIVALTAPANGASYPAPATLNLSASATANGHTLTKVQFYNGANLLGESASAPYTLAWSSVGIGSYSLTARLVFDATNTLDSAATSVTVTNQLPVIVLVSPTNNMTVSAPALIACTASVLTNGHTINKVLFYSSTNLLGEADSAPYTLVWNCTNSGVYSLTGRLVYDSGTTLDSAAVTVDVKPAPPGNTRIITIVGSGTVTSSVSAQSMVVGTTYTVTAVPAADQLFAGWNGSIDSSSPTLSFVLTTNFAIKANFTPVPTNWPVASYYGLFYESNQVQPTSSGAFVLSCNKHARYSGYLQLGGTRLAFHGQFDAQGRATNSLARRGASPLALQFHLAGGFQSAQIQGAVAADSWVAELSADRSVFNPHSNPAPLQGIYTLRIPGQDPNDPALPTGHSFGLVRIDAGGRIQLAASLADGTKFSQSAPLSADGQWGLYAPLYAGQGSMLSWLAFTNRPTDDFNGALSWFKPANSHARYYPGGFINDCQAMGSAYVRPLLAGTPVLNLTSATLSFMGGDLRANLTNLLAETSSGHLSNISSNRLSLSFSPATGAFRGSVTDPASGSSMPFSGAVFQKAQAGYGFLLGGEQSSRVELTQ